jgi:hypothetical protein
MMASTAANVIGSTISLTAPNADPRMIATTTNPTKLQAHTPNRGSHRMKAGPLGAATVGAGRAAC